MGVADWVITSFKQRQAAAAVAEAADASERKRVLDDLLEHPGWKLLIETLTPAERMVYDRWLEGREVTPEQQAFARLVRKLQEGPALLLEAAQDILRDAQGRGDGGFGYGR